MAHQSSQCKALNPPLRFAPVAFTAQPPHAALQPPPSPQPPSSSSASEPSSSDARDGAVRFTRGSSVASSAAEAVYRGSHPRPRHLAFLRQLGLRTILSLTPKSLVKYADDAEDEGGRVVLDWCKEHHVRIVHIKCEKVKEVETIGISQASALEALRVILCRENQPLYVHDLDGQSILPLLLAILRKVQGLFMPSIHAELLRTLREIPSEGIPKSVTDFVRHFGDTPIEVSTTIASSEAPNIAKNGNVSSSASSGGGPSLGGSKTVHVRLPRRSQLPSWLWASTLPLSSTSKAFKELQKNGQAVTLNALLDPWAWHNLEKEFLAWWNREQERERRPLQSTDAHNESTNRASATADSVLSSSSTGMPLMPATATDMLGSVSSTRSSSPAMNFQPTSSTSSTPTIIAATALKWSHADVCRFISHATARGALQLPVAHPYFHQRLGFDLEPQDWYVEHPPHPSHPLSVHHALHYHHSGHGHGHHQHHHRPHHNHHRHHRERERGLRSSKGNGIKRASSHSNLSRGMMAGLPNTGSSLNSNSSTSTSTSTNRSRSRRMSLYDSIISHHGVDSSGSSSSSSSSNNRGAHVEHQDLFSPLHSHPANQSHPHSRYASGSTSMSRSSTVTSSSRGRGSGSGSSSSTPSYTFSGHADTAELLSAPHTPTFASMHFAYGDASSSAAAASNRSCDCASPDHAPKYAKACGGARGGTRTPQCHLRGSSGLQHHIHASGSSSSASSSVGESLSPAMTDQQSAPVGLGLAFGRSAAAAAVDSTSAYSDEQHMPQDEVAHSKMLAERLQMLSVQAQVQGEATSAASSSIALASSASGTTASLDTHGPGARLISPTSMLPQQARRLHHVVVLDDEMDAAEHSTPKAKPTSSASGKDERTCSTLFSDPGNQVRNESDHSSGGFSDGRQDVGDVAPCEPASPHRNAGTSNVIGEEALLSSQLLSRRLIDLPASSSASRADLTIGSKLMLCEDQATPTRAGNVAGFIRSTDPGQVADALVASPVGATLSSQPSPARPGALVNKTDLKYREFSAPALNVLDSSRADAKGQDRQRQWLRIEGISHEGARAMQHGGIINSPTSYLPPPEARQTAQLGAGLEVEPDAEAETEMETEMEMETETEQEEAEEEEETLAEEEDELEEEDDDDDDEHGSRDNLALEALDLEGY
ncbi:hypothetical protein K437DRAFT_257263 [Tilletiaria anomala UBC 951]|uniref:Uncharacterized protein n=1 Tax=Tilletiaria anomala (strain ATCC 24038 / CBS 436.72 / UBC 951) TaxID=1037660 RepID=A0A066VR74_TILAU|nr:uncharacterized protein K437DRAFT_257263 [Tilletiaria anomala UBC 951]KDN43956.1 hypothetical protein K437DRAFT_257263 [Tilletiaria anomala UBC 951]